MGCCANLLDLAVPNNVNLEELEFHNRKIDLERIQKWVEKYNKINGLSRFLQSYMPLSRLYQTSDKPLLSIKASGLMAVER